ncbi:hypothetical protein JXM67_12765, partial [candidate division WOR-3 bacterium]|nr:hypothetical protein [candidate division WOR-3 bacterium]
MKRIVILVVLVFGVFQVGEAKQTDSNSRLKDYFDAGSSTSSVTLPEESSNYIGKLKLPFALQERDTFATFAYTYGDVVIFSYADDNEVELLDSLGNLVADTTLMLNEYLFKDELVYGVYQIIATKPFSVLSGDPFDQGLGCWYPVDEHSRPLSTKLLNVGPKFPPNPGQEDAIHAVFAYQDNTHIVIRNLNTDAIVWEGDKNAGEYYMQDFGDPIPQVFSIESSYPVSARTACGVNGNYIPSFNGTFTGLEFYAYQHRWGGDAQHTMITPWEDNTTVRMWPITADPEHDSPIRTEHCARRGNLTMFAIPERTAVYIRSDKPISLSQTQWSGPSIIYFYMVRGIDEDGLGMGTEFFIPLECTGGEYPSRLNVIAFSDQTNIRVTRIDRYDFIENRLIYTGTLDRGEYFRYTCGAAAVDVAIYRVEADQPVSVIGSCADFRGSDFLPLWFAIHPSVAVLPDQFGQTECLIPYPYEVTIENNGNTWDIINMDTMNTRCTEFSTELSTILGGALPDADGNGEPDTDTLGQGGTYEVLAEVTPVDRLPFGYTDTCYLSVLSARNPDRLDTAILVTTIREIAVSVDSNTTLQAYPGSE